MNRNGFDRRQIGKARIECSHRPVTFGWVGDFFVVAKGDSAAPVIGIYYLVDLKAGSRVCAKRLKLSSRQRVRINALPVQDIIDRDNIRTAFIHTAEAPNPDGGKECARFLLAQWCDHRRDSVIRDT